MTYYLGKVGRAGARLVSSCKDLYNDVNAAYLTGAIDVIVVRQRDGTLKSTPFHVRFGKLGVLRTGDLKEVEIEVNGAPIDLTMNIDETGKVFYARTRQDVEKDHVSIDMTAAEGCVAGAGAGDSQQQRDPLPDQQQRDPLPDQQQRDPLPGGPTASMAIPTPSPRQPAVTLSLPNASALDIELVSSEELMSSSLPYSLEIHSDSALDTGIDGADDAGDPVALSDTEVEVNERRSMHYWERSKSRRINCSSKGEVSANVMTNTPDEDLRQQPGAISTGDVDRAGIWNAILRILMRKHSNRVSSSTEDGIYLDDIDYESMDPQELSKFFPTSSVAAEAVASCSQDVVGSSGIGSSPTFSLSPSQSMADLHREAQLKESLAQLISTLDGVGLSLCGGLAQGTVTEDTFQNSSVSFAAFCCDPVSVLSHPSLVVRVEGRYYTWQVAAPLLMSSLVFLQVLPGKAQDKVTDKHMPKKEIKQSFWNFWGRGQKEAVPLEPERAKSEGATPMGSPHKWPREEEEERERRRVGHVVRKREEPLSSDEEGEVGVAEVATRPRQRSLKRNKKIGFTNNLTSEQLESLNLEPGANQVKFSITTKFQGTAKANCTVYLWHYTDKIIVSDIDGTITRSDVAGQVLPLLGMDWTQNGVVELFTGVSRNGYKLVYLSARAIGQAGYTKEFLRKVRRGTCSLPDGPLFLFPFSLYTAFKKEIIERRPEEFKIQCLKQIQSIFPPDVSPMHAGFGNRHNDVKSYMNVGIPESRIFTVNHKGILRHELSLTFQSSYSSLMEIVDTQFPPLRCRVASICVSVCEDREEEEPKEEYSSFNYWRSPIDSDLLFELPDIT